MDEKTFQRIRSRIEKKHKKTYKKEFGVGPQLSRTIGAIFSVPPKAHLKVLQDRRAGKREDEVFSGKEWDAFKREDKKLLRNESLKRVREGLIKDREDAAYAKRRKALKRKRLNKKLMDKTGPIKPWKFEDRPKKKKPRRKYKRPVKLAVA